MTKHYVFLGLADNNNNHNFKFFKSHCLLLSLRPQSINCLIHVNFALKNGAGGWVEVKKFEFLRKKHIHTASQLPNMFC